MKQFNLEEYLKNPSKKVVTRMGRKVRIICTDREDSIYPIIALIKDDKRESEILVTYTKDGIPYEWSESVYDLFFAPEKKEGWVKVYYGKSRCNTFVCNRIFATKKEAEKQKNDNVVAIIKIEWEE